ncbi:MAG: ATP F0F1 synthase subunit B, partial [Methylobacteriaceae bacterium]|nr:ATP F0F1 synthase subunit B [Methylobacteriaceae bacterium]
MGFSAEFFVLLGFIIFVLLLAYFGAHRTVFNALDARARRIEGELAEAKRLREEATAVLASFEKKRAEAEAEAAGIIAQARAEAEMLAKETEARMTDFVARRSKQAEAKIALAEAQATADVKAAAAEAAVQAAEAVLKNDIKGPAAD